MSTITEILASDNISDSREDLNTNFDNLNTDKLEASDIAGKEDVSNKKTSLADDSDTFYPSQKAVKTAVDAKQDALGYTAENSSNKKTDLTDNSDTFYPSQKAVKTAVDGKMTNPMKTAGDVIYGGASGTPTRLAVGTAGQVLSVKTGATELEWKDASAGTGDVIAPASNTDGKIPQWDGADSKTLKDGLTVVTTVGTPGADTSIPTEQAVREAISSAGGGDVSGPASSTDNNIAVFDGETGKIIKDGGATIASKQDALTFGIADTNAVKIDSADVADDEFARFTANGLESRSASEVRGDLGLATSDSPQFTGIELGNASDTTLSRSAAGVLAVEGVVIPSISSTNTLTNKTLTDAKFTTSINAQTGTAYTLVLTDNSKLITLTNDDAITLTIPTNASLAFPIGTQIDLVQGGAGAVTFAGADITINSKDGNLTTNGQYVGVSLIKTDTNTWLLLGDLTA